MEIFGLPTMIVLPVALVILLAVSMGAFRLFTAGTRRALVSVVRIVVYGGFAVFVLIMGLLGAYYANGGH